MKGVLGLCEKYYKTKNLYEVLNIDKKASKEQIRKAFYKLSLVVHPDRVSEDNKEIATEKFKILAFVHTILSDEEKRKVYDQTGCVEDEDDSEAMFKSDIDWIYYWKSLYKDVTEQDILEYEIKYKGSAEEANDLKRAYVQGEGDMDLIFELVPYTNPNEEDRYRKIIQDLIDKDEVPSFKTFTHEPQVKRDKRKRKFEKEEKQFEKDLKRRESKKKSSFGAAGSGEDNSMDLVAAIRNRNQNREGLFNNLISSLEEKYGGKEAKGGKEKKKKTTENNEQNVRRSGRNKN